MLDPGSEHAAEPMGHTCRHSSDTLNVAHRPRHSLFPMIPVAQAQSTVLEQCNLPTVEKVSYLTNLTIKKHARAVNALKFLNFL